MAGRASLKYELVNWIQDAEDAFEQIWDDIGICENLRTERINVVVEHVKTMLGEMLGEENSLKVNLLKSIEDCAQEITEISKELELSDYVPGDGLTVIQRENELRLKLDELTKIKHKRLKNLSKLRQENTKLSSCLGAEPFYIPPAITPSEEFLVQIAAHTKTLIAEKEYRLKTFYATKNLILDLFRVLEREPTVREKLIYDDENIILSLETLEKMKCLKDELDQLNTEKESEAIVLRESLTKLWDRLQIEQFERDKFLASYPGHKPSTVKALKHEIDKLRQLQRQNIKKFVTNLRDEIVKLWDKCFYAAEQRDLFRAFHDDSFSEELLDLHILEVEKLTSYLEENKELLQKVLRRDQLWKQMLEFEKKALDRNRFTNRGGNLLLEEKERKKLLKDLPKLEGELESLALAWESKHEKIFRINGQRLVDYMAAEWENHRLEKEAEKAERQRAKVKQIEEEMYKGSKKTTPSVKRKLETPKSSRKRMLDGPSVGNKSSRVHSSMLGYHTPARRLSRSAKAGSKPPISRRRKSRTAPSGTILGNRFKENLDVFNETDLATSFHNATTTSIASTAAYGDFSNNLQTRDHGIFNSTSLPNSKLSPQKKEINLKAEKESCRSSCMTPGKSPNKTKILKSRGKHPLFR